MDTLTRAIYSNDASEFQEMPIAVAFPRSDHDVRRLIEFARTHRVGLIPRAAGTSLAGQVVGAGIVIDMGRHLNRILCIDPEKRRARVQPGVIRNDLNVALRPHGFFFAPETSTADRAMIGGMVGNNSCGANSIMYGSTRDRLVSARGFLGDGSLVEFGPLDEAEFRQKCEGPDSLETRIYRRIRDLFGDPAQRRLIEVNFPKRSVSRRNTGYALDALIDARVFDPASDRPFNLCRLIAGSEGTLFLGIEFELALDPLPPPPVLLCAHFRSIFDALQATVFAMKFSPSAVELIDRHVLAATADSPAHQPNRFFLQGDPEAVLAIEFRASDPAQAVVELESLARALSEQGLGYAYPILTGTDVERVWALRRAGQALIMNTPGETKPAEVIEDTAVAVEDLPKYFNEFDEIVRGRYGLDCVYYGHAGAGEIHARPYLNLKTDEGRRLFRALAEDIAALVKKYRGSLSGEHGDGRLRGEFLRFMVGDACYKMMREIKALFDPDSILNPGKIIDAPPMDRAHRHEHAPIQTRANTYFLFSREGGLLRAIEKCNGAGVCRRSHLAGGTMCPSYMATREERDTTRARANLLRIALAHPPDPARPFDNPDVLDVLDLCLACKACKSECPTQVDMAKLKAEFLQHYADVRGAPLRARLIANFADFARVGALVPTLWNALARSGFFHRVLGFDRRRALPIMPSRAQARRFRINGKPTAGRTVYLFIDEFIRYQDPAPGLAAIELLRALGYSVRAAPILESGRAAISKGFLRRAQKIAAENVARLAQVISETTPLIGIEPSALLSFRDEYPDLLRDKERNSALHLAKNTFLLEEFLARELDGGKIARGSFRPAGRVVHLHGHCHQRALSSLATTVRVLQELGGYDVRVIPSGCCGLAGSFGYELGHYEISMKIGELVLFPYIRELPHDHLIAATGSSCRRQILDGCGRVARHPAELLVESLTANSTARSQFH